MPGRPNDRAYRSAGSSGPERQAPPGPVPVTSWPSLPVLTQVTWAPVRTTIWAGKYPLSTTSTWGWANGVGVARGKGVSRATREMIIWGGAVGRGTWVGGG